MKNPPEIAGQLIEAFANGSPDAQAELWEKCHQELIRYARNRLVGLTAKQELAEEVALSALKSFMIRAEDGRFPELAESSNVWRLLYRIASRKAQKAYKKHDRERSPAEDQLNNVEATVDSLSDVVDDLMLLIDDEKDREIAQLRLSGFNNREIAERVGTYPESVRRRLQRIMDKWQAYAA